MRTTKQLRGTLVNHEEFCSDSLVLVFPKIHLLNGILLESAATMIQTIQ